MCGIAGAVGLRGELDPARTQRVLDALRHRGPDTSGSRQRDGRWLGFRRLSIQDLTSRADQPMVDERSGVVIVFNGEIYNFVELRAELEAKGRTFETTGDTEVLLQAYLEWGLAAFERCNGMWAVAIDDPARAGLVLVRDRFGEKPLHVGRADDGSWWFASEIRALVEAGAGSGRIDAARALSFLVLGDVEDPVGSYFDGISQVPPGAVVSLTEAGPTEARPWFNLHEFVLGAWDHPVAPADEVLDALDQSVRLRLRSDVPVGTSLSGGIDSSTIVASLRTVDPDRELHTFTASFPGQAIDEWDRAALVGERFGVRAHRVEPTAEGFLSDLDAIVEHQGGPIESPTVYAQWCVMRRAHEEGITVLLDGQGADETWGGYPKYLTVALGDALARGRPDVAVEMVQTWRSAGRLPRIDPRQSVGLLAGPRARGAMRQLLVRRRTSDLGPILTGPSIGDPQGATSKGRLLARAAGADLGRVILPRLLRYADRNSMAWSRELRLPFLDPALMTMALSSRWDEGFRSGWTKAALRKIAATRLPDEIVWRRDKTAYETPDTRWLARADVADAVEGAARSLHDHGLIARPSLGGLNPWRVLSLARLMDGYRLTA